MNKGMVTRSQNKTKFDDLSDCVLEQIHKHLLKDPPCFGLLLSCDRSHKFFNADSTAFDKDILVGIYRSRNINSEEVELRLQKNIDGDLEKAYAGDTYRGIVVAEHNAEVFKIKYPHLVLNNSRKISFCGEAITSSQLLQRLDEAKQLNRIMYSGRNGLLTAGGLNVSLKLSKNRKHYTWD